MNQLALVRGPWEDLGARWTPLQKILTRGISRLQIVAHHSIYGRVSMSNLALLSADARLYSGTGNLCLTGNVCHQFIPQFPRHLVMLVSPPLVEVPLLGIPSQRTGFAN